MQNERKKLEELNLLDDFLFNAMMTYPEMGEESLAGSHPLSGK